MKIKNLLAGMVLVGTSAFAGNIWAADWGPCRTASGDPFIFTTSFTKNIQNPTDNVAGQTYTNFYQWALGDKYSGVCECPSPTPTESRPTLYKAESTLPAGHDSTYFKITNNLEVSSQVFIANVGYVQVPFVNRSNRQPGKECDQPSSGWTTGSKGQLSLYIAKPFVGEQNIPQTTIVSVYGTKAENVYGSVPMSEVLLSGKVTVTQGCELAAGTALDIDFGEYQAHDFKDRVGQPPQNVRKIQKELTFNCNNISDGVHIYLSLEGSSNPAYPSAINLGNADVGAIIEDGKGNILKPNDDNSLLEMDSGTLYEDVKRTAKITITAYPVSTTGKLPTAGDYDGVATMHVELE
ncbi:TPA: long polar fimbrial protein LpfD [Escherichia coli]|nr:long polar fimbrial protein LpfD [Escherichia coli]